MVKVLVSVFLVLALTSGSLAGRRGKNGRRGCGRSEERVGLHFKWSVTGLDSDDLRVSYGEGAFAPENSTVVHKYPLDRGQRALGVVPAKIFYDFSGRDPVAVLKMGKRGTGVCIVVSSDVDTYDELITMMRGRNMSNTDMPTEEEAVRLTATLTTDDSQFSDSVRDQCSKDKCGRTVQPVYYVTQLAADEAEDEGEAVAEVAQVFEPNFVLFDTRYTISGMPDPRQQRRWQRRQDRRNSRRQNRRRQNGRRQNGANHEGDAGRDERRQQRRQERRERRRQGGAVQPSV